MAVGIVDTTALDQAVELELCRRDPAFFIHEYCQIYDSVTSAWIPFHLWEKQHEALQAVHQHKRVVCLKARQEGLTWIFGVAFTLWHSLFEPIAYSMLFSVTEDESKVVLKRLVGMYDRLPEWMREKYPIKQQSTTALEFANESQIKAYATTRGDSNIATYAFIDEADLVPDLDEMLGRVLPTVEAGGKLVLNSRVDKRRPNTAFKQIYIDAVKGENDYCPIFIPWHAHPNRDEAWYQTMVRNAPSMDSVHEQYPATDQEALALGYQGRIYPMFSYEQHVTPLAEFQAGLQILWGCDLGFSNPHCFLMAQPHGEVLHIFGEYYQNQRLEGQAIRESIHTPRNTSGLFPPPDDVFYDPESPTFNIELQNFAIEQNLRINIAAANNRVADGIKTVQRFLGTRRILIHPRCKNLIREIAEYHYADSGAVMTGGDVKPALGQDDHAMSAIRYLLTPWFYEHV